jgi:hypothetical protein
MKNFFEFYHMMKNKKLHEQDMGQGQNMGGGMPGMGGGMPNMGGGGGMPGGMGGGMPVMPQPGPNQNPVIGQDMDLDMAADDKNKDTITRQTDEPQGEQDPNQQMENLKSLHAFVENLGTKLNDKDKEAKQKELKDQILAVMENLAALTGTEVPSFDNQAEGEMGGPESNDSAGMPMDMGGGASPLGSNNAGVSPDMQMPDMGGGMGGGDMTGGMGNMNTGGGASSSFGL